MVIRRSVKSISLAILPAFSASILTGDTTTTIKNLLLFEKNYKTYKNLKETAACQHTEYLPRFLINGAKVQVHAVFHPKF